MNKSITKHLNLIERRSNYLEHHYSRYIPDYFIDTKTFSAVIEEFGGYTYNLSVGRIDDITIFSGYTWFSVHGVDSYEDGDMWAKKFEEAFLKYVNENNLELKKNKMFYLYAYGCMKG